MSLKSFIRREDGTVFRVGDTVLVQPEGGGNEFIAEIKEIREPSGDGDHQLSVTWFYRPEEVVGGRKIYHGRDEVLRSDHDDLVDAGTLLRKCVMAPLDKYQAMARPLKEDVFFSRFFYYSRTRKFKPDKAPTFCVCKTPFNPDLEMRKCKRCGEFFHLHCMQLMGNATLGETRSFDCRLCRLGMMEPTS